MKVRACTELPPVGSSLSQFQSWQFETVGTTCSASKVFILVTNPRVYSCWQQATSWLLVLFYRFATLDSLCASCSCFRHIQSVRILAFELRSTMLARRSALPRSQLVSLPPISYCCRLQHQPGLRSTRSAAAHWRLSSTLKSLDNILGSQDDQQDPAQVPNPQKQKQQVWLSWSRSWGAALCSSKCFIMLICLYESAGYRGWEQAAVASRGICSMHQIPPKQLGTVSIPKVDTCKTPLT
jgi:hypothetical protein